MKQSFSALQALWMAMAIVLVPIGASAQMDFSLDESESGEGDSGDTGDSGEGGMEFGLDEADGDGTEGGAEGDGTGEGLDFGDGTGDIIGDLAAGGEQEEQRDAAPRRTETVEEVFAVQRSYVLRANRVELAPSASFTVNDPFLSHPAFAVGLNYWWTNVLALGVSFQWFQWGDPQSRESDLNFFVRRSTRLGIPVNEWQLGAYLNFTYVPFYGKFSVFNNFIFQWDAYIVGGVGLMRTRPIPVIDPEIREFDFQNRVAFNLGLGLRVFVSKFLGIFVEFRDYAFLERFENLEVSANDGPCEEPGTRCNPSTWFANSTTFSNNATVHVGFTLFFPFTFDYDLPK
ncbi:MAG: outer membrane beta-barrel domain-containing protein [Myxococcota bacterium]